MKRIPMTLFVLLVGSIFASSFGSIGRSLGSSTGTIWTKYSSNPVLSDASEPSIIYDGHTFKMWYSNYAGAGIYKICYAVSNDGVDWTLRGDVLEKGEAGSWEDYGVRAPEVLFDGTIYRMWYLGYRSNWRYMIGYATSSDGIVWTKNESNPVLVPGGNGGWDDWCLSDCAVILDGTLYRMWYSGYEYFAGSAQIGAATSADGVIWTKHSNNPVLTPGPSSWDSGHVFAGPTITNGTHFLMWYLGQRREHPAQVGLATSPDGFSWSKYENNPVLEPGSPGSWDSDTVWPSSVLEKGNNLLMWYTASNGVTVGIGLATSYANLLGLETVVSFESFTTIGSYFDRTFTIQQNFEIAVGGSLTHRYWAQNVVWVWPKMKYIPALMFGIFEIRESFDGGQSYPKRIVWWFPTFIGMPRMFENPVVLRSTIEGNKLVMKNNVKEYDYLLASNSYVISPNSDPEIAIVGHVSSSQNSPGTAIFGNPTRGHVDAYVRMGNIDGIWLHTISYVGPMRTGEKSSNLKWNSNGDFYYQEGAIDQGLLYYPDYSSSVASPP